MMIKAVILIGGPSKGTRFRPLSLDAPKPLFPVAGIPIIEHHIEACKEIKGLCEILIIGYYPAYDLKHFVETMIKKHEITTEYLEEYSPLGTAGGLHYYRERIRAGNPDFFFVMNGDVCADFPLDQLLDCHKKTNALLTIMATEATRQQSLNYGCIVIAKDGKVSHYVEKPSTFVSTLINCGVYVLTPEIFSTMAEIVDTTHKKHYISLNKGRGDKDLNYIALEEDVLTRLAGSGSLYAVTVKNWWSQVKTAGSTIYSNGRYLALYRAKYPCRLTKPSDVPCTIIGDVFIDPTALVQSTAVIGPNVSIGYNAMIGVGVRIRESIVLDDTKIEAHSIVLHSIVGMNCVIGKWARVEGTPCDPNPNKPFAKMENPPLFNSNGTLNPSITILGNNVRLPSGKMLLNSIVLPHKRLTRSFKNEIIL